MFGGEHLLGGISGYDAAENPERVAFVQQVTLAYLRHVLGLDSFAWTATQAALTGAPHPMGRLESK
ncbi:hypothetical protein [Actinomadura verrucosospora]|uniref:Chlorophyllase n=1 Tax=Actinomadura verrucosospora TaxID=46165 RepID=A0A7D3ZU65_ACTVE|nr:hypothetical protein [Actinomadura verrucosospora]QKG18726.1 chlorophyllase [Actinomadura verrucosospora]